MKNLKLIISLLFVLGIVFLAQAQEGVPQEGVPQEDVPQEDVPQEDVPQEDVPQEEQMLVPEDENYTLETEDKVQIETTNIPFAVLEAFASSDYRNMTILEAYELRGEALDEIPTVFQESKPDILYELLVEDSTRSLLLYFTRDGELYDTIEKV